MEVLAPHLYGDVSTSLDFLENVSAALVAFCRSRNLVHYTLDPDISVQ